MDLPTLPLHGWISSLNTISHPCYHRIEFNMFIDQILDTRKTLWLFDTLLGPGAVFFGCSEGGEPNVMLTFALVTPARYSSIKNTWYKVAAKKLPIKTLTLFLWTNRYFWYVFGLVTDEPGLVSEWASHPIRSFSSLTFPVVLFECCCFSLSLF